MTWIKIVPKRNTTRFPTFQECVAAGASYGSEWMDDYNRIWTLRHDPNYLGAYWENGAWKIKAY